MGIGLSYLLFRCDAMNASSFRFRKLDRWNFVIERRCQGSSERWVIEGYYYSLELLVKSAVRLGICGDSGQELLASVAMSESRVLAALRMAVESGAIEKTPTGPCERQQAICTTQGADGT